MAEVISGLILTLLIATAYCYGQQHGYFDKMYTTIVGQEIMTPETIRDWSRGKTIIMTGGNSDLALGALEHLLTANSSRKIVLTCRTQDKCQSALDQLPTDLSEKRHTQVRIVEMDLLSNDSLEQAASKISKLSSKAKGEAILVWNAHAYASTDNNHSKTRSEVSHLYLTHLLQSSVALSRVVVVGSVAGAVEIPANLLQALSSFAKPAVKYMQSKRNVLHLAYQLQRESEINNNVLSKIKVVATHPGLTRHASDIPLSWISMTPHTGSLSHVRAMLDPHLPNGAYVGHTWGLWGSTTVGGSVASSWFHTPLHTAKSQQLWHQTLQQLNITHFGVQRPRVPLASRFASPKQQPSIWMAVVCMLVAGVASLIVMAQWNEQSLVDSTTTIPPSSPKLKQAMSPNPTSLKPAPAPFKRTATSAVARSRRPRKGSF